MSSGEPKKQINVQIDDLDQVADTARRIFIARTVNCWPADDATFHRDMQTMAAASMRAALLFESERLRFSTDIKSGKVV